MSLGSESDESGSSGEDTSLSSAGGSAGWCFWFIGVCAVGIPYFIFVNPVTMPTLHIIPPHCFYYHVMVFCAFSLALVLWHLVARWRSSQEGGDLEGNHLLWNHQAVSLAKDDAENWGHEEAEPIFISSKLTSVLATVAILVYPFVLAVTSGERILSMAWQCCLTGCLCSTLHLSLAMVPSNAGLGFAPVVVYFLLLPFATHDRLPFTFTFTQGCPPPINGVVFLLGFLCAALLYGRGSISLRQVREPYPGWRPERRQNRITVPFEVFSFLSAALSIGYWMAIFARSELRKKGHLPSEVGHDSVEVAYHCCWSLLRPSYVATFLLYWSKSMPKFRWVQAALCGFGVVNFGLLATIASTALTVGDNVVCSGGGEMVHNRGKADHHADFMGTMGHNDESYCFYFSMLMFILAGFASDKWLLSSGRKLEVGIAAIMCCCFVGGIWQRWSPHCHGGDAKQRFWIGYSGLWPIAIFEGYLLCRGRRLRLILDLVHVTWAPRLAANGAEE